MLSASIRIGDYNMKILIIGLGSMGKRRVRNLQALKQKDIFGFDVQQTRCDEVNTKYNIITYNNFEDALAKIDPDIFIISTPPDLHMKYAYIALEHSIDCFIEASVVHSGKILELSQKIKDTKNIIVPSCTMRYFAFTKKIKQLISNGTIGKPLNFNYQTGQYLPDWHPWEKLEDFYVSNRSTGAGREIVPFELTWLNDIFGDAKPLACVKRKLTNINANIDDIYHCILEYPNNIVGNLTVEVVSRPVATREFRLIGSKGQMVFSADTNSLKYINIDMKEWKTISFETGSVEKMYINPEEPYINEMSDFLNAVKNKNADLYPNSLEDDYKILNNLYDLEKLTGENCDELSR
jgi:predicted dehydrogenase